MLVKPSSTHFVSHEPYEPPKCTLEEFLTRELGPSSSVVSEPQTLEAYLGLREDEL